ncbi:MAG: arginine--tRNA ligase [Candidatus Ancillula trichonymphae]|nr:arginine--tRNA ligase [Candidatus Ancillula trichonymphae]
MSPEKLQVLIADAIKQLHPTSAVLPTDVDVKRPRNSSFGDWAVNVAMKFYKQLEYKNPREAAVALVEQISSFSGVKRAQIDGPGFINIVLDTASGATVVRDILKKGADFGRTNVLENTRINLEFVSANPTGPLHIGGVRWAALGDALARILEFTGAKVEREYYFNDHGVQIERFARSLVERANGRDAPVDGYGGDYITQISNQVVEDAAKQGLDILALDEGVASVSEAEIREGVAPTNTREIEEFRARGVELMFPQIKKSLEDFGVHFDRFFHEQNLYDDKKVDKAIEKLQLSGDVYEKDGALWVATSKYGDDKDRVVIKSDGQEAYFAADIAYYLEKRTRADVLIYILGADHAGYIGRLKAISRAFGDDADKQLRVLLGQLVNLVKDGEPVRLSKRAGNVITIDDLVEEVGVDAARYSLVRSSHDTPLELDLNLLASHVNENPVYYVQYAHARTQSVLRNAATILGASEQKLMENAEQVTNEQLQLLSHETETALVGVLASFSATVQSASSLMEPHRVVRYSEELAAAYHRWYSACRVLPGPRVSEELSTARMALNLAAGQVVKQSLALLGVSAPNHRM